LYIVQADEQNGSNQAGQYAPQYQPYLPQYPQYQQPYPPPAPQYQVPPSQLPSDNTQSNKLAQLQLLGPLRQQGTLTKEEFQAEKQRILNG
jgi:hypothetical protein